MRNLLQELEESVALSEKHPNLNKSSTHAEHLLRRFMDLGPNVSLPHVGTDDETIVLGWNDDNHVGSLTVHADGVYSFYVKNKDSGRAAKGVSKVDDKIPADLVTVLMV